MLAGRPPAGYDAGPGARCAGTPQRRAGTPQRRAGTPQRRRRGSAVTFGHLSAVN